MNSFSYEEALKHDFRTYSQFYISLIKTKHIFIFTFFKIEDFNSQIIKIYIFLFTFYINYTVSVMFYTDSTMHKIYIDKGTFDFTYQLPQMIYSLLISILLKTILNILGLYGSNILELIKCEKEKIEINILKTSKKIKCKIILFFIITYLLLFLFWVYLGCFCSVYKNTQVHLILDVLSSFLISFIIPFIIYLFPGIFRILSLKDRNKRSPLLFKFSKLLQML